MLPWGEVFKVSEYLWAVLGSFHFFKRKWSSCSSVVVIINNNNPVQFTQPLVFSFLGSSSLCSVLIQQATNSLLLLQIFICMYCLSHIQNYIPVGLFISFFINILCFTTMAQDHVLATELKIDLNFDNSRTGHLFGGISLLASSIM